MRVDMKIVTPPKMDMGAPGVQMWRAVDFPGGTRRFCGLLKTWTRDLGFGHVWERLGPTIRCSRCKVIVLDYYDSSKIAPAREGTAEHFPLTFQGLNPYWLRQAVRRMVILGGPCDTFVVQHVMES